MKPKVITVEEVIYLRDKLKDEYSDVHAQWREDKRFYELDFLGDLRLPKEFFADATVLPTGRQIVDVYTDHVDLANAKVTVSRKQPKTDDAAERERAEEEAEILEKFATGYLYRSLVEEDISQPRVAAKHQGQLGVGVIKTVFSADRWLDKPDQGKMQDSEYKDLIDEWRNQRNSQMPIVMQAVNPLNVYPDPSYGGRGFVIEEREKVMLDIRSQYPKWTNPKGREIDEKVTITHYFDKLYRVDLADDEPLFQIKNGVMKHKYGLIPYVFIESGLGDVSEDGNLSQRYVGILRHLRGALISASRNFSLYDVQMKLGALPWKSASGKNVDQMPDFKVTPGATVPLPEGVTIDEHPPTLAPDAVMRQMEIINGIIMDFAAPRSTQGLGESGVRSAAHAQTLANLGGVKFQYPSESFRNKTAKVLANVTTIYKNLDELNDLRVWARTPSDEFDIVIDKKKLHEPFTFHVEFAPFDEANNYVRQDAMLKLLHEGVVDPKWVRRKIPNIDWKSMEYAEKKKAIEADPAVQQQLGGLRLAMITAAVNQEMIKQGVQAAPMQSARGIPTGGMPMGDATMNRSLVAPSSPKPLPGSSRSLDLMMKGMERPEPTFQGQNGGGS